MTINDINQSVTNDVKSEDIFELRLSRLKAALEVQSESELAKQLGLTQQTLVGAKKRRTIPGSWIQKLADIEVSLDYIFYGRMVAWPNVPLINIEHPRVRNELEVAARLVQMTLEHYGVTLSADQRKMLTAYTRRLVLGKAQELIMELIDEATHL